MVALFIIGGVVGWAVLGLCFVGWWIADPPSTERARIEREVIEATWRIHNEVQEAFTEMLRAATENPPEAP